MVGSGRLSDGTSDAVHLELSRKFNWMHVPKGMTQKADPQEKSLALPS